MYTRPKYSPAIMAQWTFRDTLFLAVIATLPVVAYELFDQKWIHLPWLPIAVVGTAVAFILSFQNNASYDRMWEARKIWGGVVNVSRAWGFGVKDFITNTFCEPKRSEKELHAIHAELISRHVAWLTAFRHSMRQPRPWEVQLRVASNQQWAEAIGVVEHRVSLEEELRGDIAEEEIEYLLTKTNKATQLLGIQSKRLRELRDENLVDDFRHVELQELLDELVALQGKSERIKNFPYPRQYATLNQTFLWIFIILLPFGVMTEFDKIGNNVADSFPLIGEYFVWFSIPFAVMVMWVFHTMERIGRVTENPFEGTPNDVPITTIARGIEIDLREMIDQDPATIPAPIPAKRDTQT